MISRRLHTYIDLARVLVIGQQIRYIEVRRREASSSPATAARRNLTRMRLKRRTQGLALLAETGR